MAKAQENNQWFLSKVLDNSTGLLQNSIGSIYFDKKTGFLWITTEAGLVRYDGLNPYIFDKRLLPEMKTVRTSLIFPTLKEGVLAMDRSGMLYKMIGSEVQPFKNDSIKQAAFLIGPFAGNFLNIKTANELLSQLLINKEDITRKYDLTQLPLSTVWVNDSLWISYSTTFLKLFKYQNEVAKWKKAAFELPVLIRSGIYVYALNDNGSGYKIDPQKIRF